MVRFWAIHSLSRIDEGGYATWAAKTQAWTSGAAAPKSRMESCERAMRCPKCGAASQRGKRFCADCGTPIYTVAPEASPATYGLRVGVLDRRAELRPSRQGWCRSALPWSMDLTGVQRFERES